MAEVECIFPGTGESFSLQKSPSVLPPDNATLRLGEYGARRTAATQLAIAPLFSEVSENPEIVAHPAKIVDLGSGTGALAIAAAMKTLKYGAEISSIVAIDNDEDAAADTAHNLKTHVGRKHQGIDIAVMNADWNDPGTWDAVKDADLILCNPPYMATDGDTSIRPGFENVNPEAMYLPTSTDVFDMYTMLAMRSLTRMRPFGALYLRLPKYEPVHNDSWPMDLAASPDIQAAVSVLRDRGYECNMLAQRYEPFQYSVRRIGNDTLRHLHMLTTTIQPAKYPFIDILSDPAYANFVNGGGILSTEAYERLLHLAGYPRTSGGGWAVSEGMFNHNYPQNDPRHIKLEF